jgi:hypothetical protein
MDIDPTQSLSHQLIFLHEVHDFIVVGFNGGWKLPQQEKDFVSVPDESARQLSDHKSVADDFSLQEQRRQFSMPMPQVLNPYRGVD